MNILMNSKTVHDFEVRIDNGLLKLIPCNADAKKWVEVNYLKPLGIDPDTDIKELNFQAYELERTLRRLMNQAFQVSFVKPQAE